MRRFTWPQEAGFGPLALGIVIGAATTLTGVWWSRPQLLSPSKAACVASTASDVYHRPTCRYARKIPPGARLWFASAAEAEAGGFRACRVCGGPAPVVFNAAKDER